MSTVRDRLFTSLVVVALAWAFITTIGGCWLFSEQQANRTKEINKEGICDPPHTWAAMNDSPLYCVRKEDLSELYAAGYHRATEKELDQAQAGRETRLSHFWWIGIGMIAGSAWGPVGAILMLRTWSRWVWGKT